VISTIGRRPEAKEDDIRKNESSGDLAELGGEGSVGRSGSQLNTSERIYCPAQDGVEGDLEEKGVSREKGNEEEQRRRTWKNIETTRALGKPSGCSMSPMKEGMRAWPM
jgi:hypothetical protein